MSDGARIHSFYPPRRAVLTATVAAGIAAAGGGVARREQRTPWEALVGQVESPAFAGTAPGVPTYAGARDGPFDPVFGLYNVSARTGRVLTARVLATQRHDTSCRLVFAGDSITAGSQATGLTSYPLETLARLVAGGCQQAGTGICFAGQGVTDPRWSRAGTTTDYLTYTQMSAGGTKTFTSTVPGGQVDLWYFNTSRAFSYSIDGGAPVTVTPSGASSIGVTHVPGLANSTHSVTITSSANYCYLIGVNVFSPAAGLQVFNAGVGLSATAKWLGTGFASLFGMATMQAADGFILGIGANDAGRAVPVATYRSNLTTIATNLAARAPVGLVATNNVGWVTDAAWEPYVAAMYDVADALGVGLMDMYYCWGGYKSAAALGYEGADGAHPNAAGYADMARTMVCLLTGAKTL
jgi:hypothetical protein